jgi:hypothetical protein
MTRISRGSLEGIRKESTVTGRPQPSCMRCKVELEREFVGSAHVCYRQAGMWQTPLKSLNAYRHRSPRLTTCALPEESQVQNGPTSLTLCPLTRADALLARICPPPSSCVPIDYPNGIILLCGESVSVLHQCAASSSAKILHHAGTVSGQWARLPLLTPSPN